MNSFQIKLIALILMTIDHIGEFLFPQCDLLGYIGRLSAPLFLYILCWSIDYTRNRVRFLVRVYAASVIMDIIWILLSIGGIHTDTYNNVFSNFFIVIAVVMILENKTLSKISKICIINRNSLLGHGLPAGDIDNLSHSCRRRRNPASGQSGSVWNHLGGNQSCHRWRIVCGDDPEPEFRRWHRPFELSLQRAAKNHHDSQWL